MKLTAAPMLATCVLLLATPALAQESSRADFEELCEAMQGRWVGNVVWIADWPGMGKKGDKVKCYVENAVIEDGNAILSRFFGGSGSVTWITVYDAAAKKIKATGVSSGGTTRFGVFYKEDGKWVNTIEGSLSDGSKLKAKNFLTISDDGSKHSYNGTATIDGEPIDNLQDVWVRVSDK